MFLLPYFMNHETWSYEARITYNISEKIVPVLYNYFSIFTIFVDITKKM